jgi:hypothetical protein
MGQKAPPSCEAGGALRPREKQRTWARNRAESSSKASKSARCRPPFDRVALALVRGGGKKGGCCGRREYQRGSVRSVILTFQLHSTPGNQQTIKLACIAACCVQQQVDQSQFDHKTEWWSWLGGRSRWRAAGSQGSADNAGLDTYLAAWSKQRLAAAAPATFRSSPWPFPSRPSIEEKKDGPRGCVGGLPTGRPLTPPLTDERPSDRP